MTGDEARALLGEAYPPERVAIWWNTPRPAFGGRSPRSMWRDEWRQSVVVMEIQRIVEGAA